MRNMDFLILLILVVALKCECFHMQQQKQQINRNIRKFSRGPIFTVEPTINTNTNIDVGEGKKPIVDIEQETKKFGFEVGMFKALTNKDAASIKPADLLKKYGAAYLITSISFAIVSYAICYFLISQGVDVGVLLKKIGIEASSTANNVGTAGLAYAVHKAASPIRFPPTVALTPVVANWLGGRNNTDKEK